MSTQWVGKQYAVSMQWVCNEYVMCMQWVPMSM